MQPTSNSVHWAMPIKVLFRNPFALLIFGLAILSASNVFAYQATKITSVSGQNITNFSQPALVYVQPGQAITLQSNEVEINSYQQLVSYYQSSPYAYSWQSSADGILCYPDLDCSNTGFQLNGVGMTYVVPQYLGSTAQITVTNRYSGQTDSVTLINQTTQQGGMPSWQPPNVYAPPQYGQPNYVPQYSQYYGQVYSGYSAYPQQIDFNFTVALNGFGTWIQIGGVSVFKPYLTMPNWQPYQHGYWYWSSYGWTWQSYDSWGWVTDHYGVWRHNRIHGWVWMPFSGPQLQWRPAVVSFFNTNSHIGWSPYWQGYSYINAYDYDDGYWYGYNGAANNSYSWGWSVVPLNQFTAPNVYSACVRDGRQFQYFSESYRYGSYGERAVIVGPGMGARHFIERHAEYPVRAYDVDVRDRRVYGGGSIQFVQPRGVVVEPPVEYRRQFDDARGRISRGEGRPNFEGGRPGFEPGRGGPVYRQPPAAVQPPQVQPQPQPMPQQPPVYQQPPGRGGDDGRRGGFEGGRPGFEPGRGGPVYRQPPAAVQPPQVQPQPQPMPQQPPVYQQPPGRPGFEPGRGGDDGRRGGFEGGRPEFRGGGGPVYQQPPQVQPQPMPRPEPRFEPGRSGDDGRRGGFEGGRPEFRGGGGGPGFGGGGHHGRP